MNGPLAAEGEVEKLEEEVWVPTPGIGGVSAFAIQIAAAAGATVITTFSSDEKLGIARSLGAKNTIEYRSSPQWAEEALRITAGKGVDHFVDVGCSGNANEAFSYVKSSNAVGRVVVVC